jgi:hypothetical protein
MVALQSGATLMTIETAPEHAALAKLYDDALREMVDAILQGLLEGRKPARDRQPELSWRDNGMPSLTDGSYSSVTGPLKYSGVLEPPYGDEEARRRGAYPADRFPVLHALTAMVAENSSRAPGLAGLEPSPITQIHAQLQVAGAADLHFHRFGVVATTDASRAAVLRPLMNGLLKTSLDLAILAPIALTRFDFDRLRLAPDAFVMRMSPQLQKARWSGKAYGANGHDEVLAAATHAFVLTGWCLPNDNFWGLSQTLSVRTPVARDAIEVLFAALRLVTGIETGHAQEVCLARGWCNWVHMDWPQVYALGARRYPEVFDNFGWTRDDIPLVTAIRMKEVATVYQAIKSQTAQRLGLALRRFNAATIRDDPSDAILDATIALEILLGDADNQAIGWKLRMRAGALAGIGGDQARIDTTRADVAKLYDLRSTIVHGVTGKRATKAAKTQDQEVGRRLAIETLRSVLQVILKFPRYLDPLVIDRDLLLRPSAGDG